MSSSRGIDKCQIQRDDAKVIIDPGASGARSPYRGSVNKLGLKVWGAVWALTEVLLLVFQKQKSTVGINTTSCFENVLGNLYMD